jgi:hypothetical protein
MTRIAAVPAFIEHRAAKLRNNPLLRAALT